MTPEQLQSLHAAVYRNTGEDPMWVGFWIRHFLESEGVPQAELEGDLGIAADKLALLCLCRTPRPDNFQEDLHVICERTGARQEPLARIIRQEQAMLHWRDSNSATSPGWLLAASDRDEPGTSATEANDDQD